MALVTTIDNHAIHILAINEAETGLFSSLMKVPVATFNICHFNGVGK